MLHRASEGGVSSSPLLRRTRGNKQVEYLDLDLHTGHTTPPRQVRSLPPSARVLYFIIFIWFHSPHKPETWHKWRWRQLYRASWRRRGACTWQPHTCRLCGGGPQEDQGPEKHQGSLARRADVHREGEQDVVAKLEESAVWISKGSWERMNLLWSGHCGENTSDATQTGHTRAQL